MDELDLNWSEPKIVMTKFGERSLRTASPNQSFWELWNSKKNELKRDGFSLTKEPSGWVVLHWAKLENEEKKKEIKELSRASHLDIDLPVPEGLGYLDYQKAGIHFSKDKNTLIADEMGLGKTIQAIGVLNLHPEYENILVICPASLRLNWKREIEKWTVNDYTIGVVNRDDYPENTDILIINYDVVQKHREKLMEREWDLLIIDEAHYLKNPKAARTQAILGKGKKIPGINAKHRIFLTGTPILNRPVELFPIISSLDPERWNSFFSYAKRYCAAAGNGWGWDFSGASNLEELQDRLRSTIMIRRLKMDVLTELPSKRRQVIELPADARIKKLLKQETTVWDSKREVIENLRVALELSKVSDNVEDYRNAMANLREGIEAHFTEMAKLRQEIAILKVPYVVEHVKNATGKVVIFAHHKEVVKELKKELGDEAVVLVGDTKIEDRQAAVDAFQNDPKILYFIGSIKAAGVGITLTAASHVVFAELDWVPGNISQAEDRCVLEGQPILTTNGWVKVEDIKVGDLVISHDGKPHKVIDTFSRLARGSHSYNSKDIVELDVLGWQGPIKVTADHLMLTEVGWVEAGKLKPRDKLIMPSIYEAELESLEVENFIEATFENNHKSRQINGRLIELPSSFSINKDSMFVFGYYIGDGFSSTSDNKGRFVSMAGHVSQKSSHLSRCENWFSLQGVSSTTREDKNSLGCELRAYSGNLAFWFEKNFGRTLETKKIPEWVFNTNIQNRKAFIDGWLSSDGYTRRGRKEILTNSYLLASQAVRLVMGIGEKPCFYFNKHSGSYSISWTEGSPQTLSITKIIHRTCTKTERVYDLTVEESHTFVVGTSVVHNCHRIGQTESVLVQHLVMEGSIDVNMAQSLIEKQEIIDKALDKVVEAPEYATPNFDTGIKLPSYEKVEAEVEKVPNSEKKELLEKLRILASFDTDRAAVRNDIGFNRFDGRLGHSLAQQDFLTDKQAMLARKLVNKYRRQLEEM